MPRLVALLLAALFSLPAGALEQKSLATYAREVWTTREGLPHNQVNSITQTPEGYLWFGTWEGVVRYNGQEFRSFGRKNVPALRDNGIRSVRAGGSGALLVATSRGGVSVLRGEEWTTYTTADGLPQDETNVALEDAAGRIWVATENEGVVRLGDGPAKRFSKEEGLPSNVTYGMIEDAAGAIWVGTAEGLVRIEDDRVQVFNTTSGLPQGGIFSVAQGHDGEMYAGSQRGLFVGRGGRFARISSDFPDEAIPSLQVDSQGSIWIGTVNRGLMRFSDRGLEVFDANSGLPNNRVASLFADREGSLWVGTNAGLLRFADTPFITLDQHHGLSDDYVRAVLQGRDGGIWIGTSRGLDRAEGETIRHVGAEAGLTGDAILSLAESSDGSLWIGMYSTGLVQWKDGRVQQRYGPERGGISSQVRALRETRDGALWVGTARGLVRIRGDDFKTFGTADGLPRDFILSLHEAGDGSLWVGTSNGLGHITGEKAESVPIAAYEDAQDVFGMHEDLDGTLWFATDRGLLRLRDGHFSMVSARKGLPVDTVFQVVVDSYDNFWLTSNAGVIHVRRESLEAVADGRAPSLDYQQFAEPDGMGSAQCNGGAGPAALRARDGSIWVATAKGVAVVQPDQLPRYQLAPPPVVIEGLRVDDRSANANGSLVLPAGTRKLELDYVSLSYRTPEQIRYRYRLEGFDNSWVERNQMRNAQYTNLPPGQYRFQVSAAQRGSGWSPETASLSFEIQPHFYQRPWFLPLVGASLALMLYLLYRMRVASLEARERELSAQVAQRTRALSEKAVELEQLNERILQQSEAFERQARTDALTGLANRRSMDEKLQQEFADSVQQERPMSFGLLDIDHFKRINDGYSHQVGDDALKAVAATMLSVMQGENVARWRGDDRVARWGGEEFALMFPGMGLEQAKVSAERLRAAIESIDCSAFAPGLKITASIGLAARTGLSNYEKLVSRADEKLYEAKHAGRNRVTG